MDLSYDPAKNTRNIAERGLSFDRAADLEWSTAWIVEDLRRPYLERRFQVLGLIDQRLHMLVFTPRHGRVHVISLRRANRREIAEKARYDATKNPT